VTFDAMALKSDTHRVRMLASKNLFRGVLATVRGCPVRPACDPVE